MARPTKLTPEVVKDLITSLQKGATIRDACLCAGISVDSFNRYEKRSADFAASVKKARAKARISALERIAKAGRSGNWQADAWFLERSDPESWGRREKITIEGNLPLELVNRVSRALMEAGMDPAEVFNDLIAEAARANVPSSESGA